VPLLDRLIAAQPTWRHYDRRGLARAALGRYEQAAADFTAATRLAGRATGRRPWREMGLVRLAAGDIAGYRQCCAAAAKQPDGFLGLMEVASPRSGVDFAARLPALEKAAADAPNALATQFLLVAMRYRAGEDSKTVPEPVLEAARTRVQPSTWLFLAMREHRRGHPAEARRWFDRATQFLQDESQGLSYEWSQRLEWELLRREAQAVLSGPAPSGAAPGAPHPR
jgi:tetratricopeptide (TPR) repeat protein